MMLISVIVPIYNVETYLEEAIESLIHQKACNLEIILVDDGSTDASGKIAETYAAKYDNIVCIHQENQGLSAARNRGMDDAHGEYVMFLDSDDFFVKDSISLVQMEISDKEYDLLLYSGKKFYQNTRECSSYGIRENGIYQSGKDAYFDLRKKESYYTCVWFMVLRRAFLIEAQIRFADGILHEDHLFAFQVFMKAGKVRCACLDVYRYRIRSNSIMTGSQKNGRRFEGFLACLCEMMRVASFELKNNDILKKHIREIGVITAKYYLKMNRLECDEYEVQVDNYVRHVLNERKTTPFLLRLGCNIKYFWFR